MLKKIATLSLFAFTLQADMSSFYKEAVQTLQYEKSYTLYKQSNKTSQSAVTYSKYANFSLDAAYTNTHAKLLPTSAGNFNTTDISFSDSIDIFGKNNYKIESLHLDKKATKAQLNVKKEQLFIALVNLVSLYNRTSQELKLHQNLFTKQEAIYKKLKLLGEHGDMTKLDVLRFKNTLTTLKTKIVSQNQALVKMKKQLSLYAPDEAIPILDVTTLLFSKEDFIAHNPQATLNSLDAQKKIAQAYGMKSSYFPTLDAGVAYQKLDDPTGYGDNYSVGIALHILLNSGDFKEAEALKVSALSFEAQSITYKIQRENEYIGYRESFENASKELVILEKALSDYEESEATIKIAYLKQYVDFNTYLQVLTQALDVKKQIIAMQAQKAKEAILINTIASGKIYE
ncbi:MAG: TolC family protein [Sulfurimonas sp.]